jgi:dihydroorotase
MLCIKNGTMIDGLHPKQESMDVLIGNGVVIKIGRNLEAAGCRVIDAKGCWIMPGLIDAHCHLREPGFEYKEDIYSGTRSAAMGGFTQVACMPNTDPVLDNAPLIEFVRQKAQSEGAVKVHVIGAITKGLQGKELSEMGELKEAGATALSDDGKPVSNAGMMKRALEYAKAFDMLLISHCEDTSLSENGTMNEGYQSTILGLRGISRAAEEVMVSRDILLAEAVGAPIHIAHVSTKGSVDLVRKAKERGVRVTCETAPHYFSATDAWAAGYNSNAKVNPPLRTEEDVAAIIEGLKDGTIDIIATDHAPHHRDEKEVEFDLAANGISGFETAFALGVTNLVLPGHLTIEDLICKMAVQPAEILGIKGGTIAEGAPADIVIADPAADFTVTEDGLVSKGKNSLFIGCTLKGKIQHTLVDGKPVVFNGKINEEV